MKRSRKSNRVTWAPGLNLFQVRLFLTEDCPSKVGTQTQDLLQKKTSQMVHRLSGKEFNDLPPGFEGSHCLNPLKEESSYIPRIEWKCPPKVLMNCSWDVAAGEESQEAKAQKFREMRVLEAVFPRPSAIPPSPSISLDIEEEYYYDTLTPIIPLTPIEEEIAADIPSDLSAPHNTCLYSQSPAIPQDLSSSGTCNIPVLQPPASIKPVLGTLPDLGADLITAASAAAAALKKSMEGSLIDADLLVKIFSDPKMIEKLMNDSQVPTSKPATSLVPPSLPIPPANSLQTTVDGNLRGSGGLRPTSTPVSSSIPSSCHESTTHTVSMPDNGSLHPLLCEVQPTVNRIPQQPATVSLPRPESITELVHKPAVLNLYSMPDQVQSSVSSIMITQPITAPKLFAEAKPNLLPPTMPDQPKPNGAPKSNIPTMKTHPVKDVNYIKNLIREHGSEKKEFVNRNMSYNGPELNHIQNLEFSQNVRQKEVRSKFQKPCVYYRSPKGCRNGSSCPYQHDFSFQFHNNSGALEAPFAKRMKFGGEITGST